MAGNLNPQPAGRGLVEAMLPLFFVLLWSTGFIGAKFGLPYAEPLTFLTLRFATVFCLMLVLAVLLRAPWPAMPAQWFHIGVSGLLVHGVYQAGVFTAISNGLSSGITALVVGMQPLLTALVAGVLLGERVRRAQWGGLALGFVGVAMVVQGKVGNMPADAISGMLGPALMALLGITAGTLYQKRFCSAFDLRTGSVLQFLPCLLVVGTLAAFTESMTVQWTGEFMFALGWLVLVLSLGAVTLLNLLIRKGGAVNVASLFYLTPPATALIAWAMFGETLNGLALAGMGVAVLGVWLARHKD